jgi:hypothetical protein
MGAPLPHTSPGACVAQLPFVVHVSTVSQTETGLVPHSHVTPALAPPQGAPSAGGLAGQGPPPPPLLPLELEPLLPLPPEPELEPPLPLPPLLAPLLPPELDVPPSPPAPPSEPLKVVPPHPTTPANRTTAIALALMES